MVEFQPFGPKLPHDPEGTLEHQRDVREEAERAHDVKRASGTAHRSRLGYAVVLLGAALFVTSCFLPFYGFAFAGERSVSLYDQLLVAQDGGLELGAILFLFGGVATVVVVALVGLTRGERPSLHAFLAGAVATWSLTWLGSLLQAANLRDNALSGGRLSLEVGFWLQAVSIGVAVVGTILVWLSKRSEVKDSHDRYANEDGVDADA